jgi:hypothetical protein
VDPQRDFAVAMTAIVSAPLYVWLGLMAEFGMSWYWWAAPLPLVFLLASWWTAEDWILERSGARVRVRKTLLLVIPVTLIISVFAYVRVTEIPDVKPVLTRRPVSLATIEASTEIRTEYQQLYNEFQADPVELTIGNPEVAIHDVNELLEIVPSAEQVEWVDAHADLLKRAAEVARRGDLFNLSNQGVIDSFSQMKERRRQVRALSQMLLLAGRRAEVAGDLNEALDWYLTALEAAGPEGRYSKVNLGWSFSLSAKNQTALYSLRRWAALPNQTAERIEGALDRLAATQQRIDASDWNSPDTWALFEDRFGDEMYLVDNVAPDPMWGRRTFYLLFPWERARARRLVRACDKHLLAQFREMDRQMELGLPIRSSDQIVMQSEQLKRWRMTTPFARRWDSLAQLEVGGAQFYVLLDSLLSGRATRTVLALEAWRLEHGHWPPSLKVLVPELLDRVPIDPVMGQPFRYYPRGFANETELDWGNNSELADVATARIPAGQPFLMGHRVSTLERRSPNTRPVYFPLLESR